eukprot:9182122-Heterocapsa_arctica.AAC.1
MIPRNIPLENSVELLDNAKKGDPSISVSMSRKAGSVFGRLTVKDIGSGQKSPARRLNNIFAMGLAMQKQLLGDDLADVIV